MGPRHRGDRGQGGLRRDGRLEAFGDRRGRADGRAAQHHAGRHGALPEPHEQRQGRQRLEPRLPRAVAPDARRRRRRGAGLLVAPDDQVRPGRHQGAPGDAGQTRRREDRLHEAVREPQGSRPAARLLRGRRPPQGRPTSRVHLGARRRGPPLREGPDGPHHHAGEARPHLHVHGPLGPPHRQAPAHRHVPDTHDAAAGVRLSRSGWEA
mmetsp:Transcript_6512/g.21533  ORF Transcript_6512/g.21533 Transcript_6512/m.21533 type:complete len:209 (-) Transcript_6512:23-649(-)